MKRIGIITAIPTETRAVAAIFGASRRHDDGRVLHHAASGGLDVIIAESGMGILNAGREARALIEGYDPDVLVSAGVAGAVSDELCTGACICAERVFTISGSLLEAQSCSPLPVSGIDPGTVITGTGIHDKREVKRLLPAGTGRVVLDMETAAVATAAGDAGKGFAGVRAVSDDASEELLFTIDEIAGRDMRVSIMKILRLVLARPAVIPQFVRLGRDSSVAAKVCAGAVFRFARQLDANTH